MIDELAEAISRYSLQVVDSVTATHVGDGLHVLRMRAISGLDVRWLLDARQVEQLNLDTPIR